MDKALDPRSNWALGFDFSSDGHMYKLLASFEFTLPLAHARFLLYRWPNLPSSTEKNYQHIHIYIYVYFCLCLATFKAISARVLAIQQRWVPGARIQGWINK